jgi:hypothetical protein
MNLMQWKNINGVIYFDIWLKYEVTKYKINTNPTNQTWLRIG